MGSRLVGRAIAYALPQLPQAETKAALLLTVMAHHAVDSDERPYSVKGDDYYAQRLGYPSDSQAGTRAVRRAREVLREWGFVEPWPVPRATSKARRWALTLPSGPDS